MRHLFGPFCSGDAFQHDNEMMKIYEARLESASKDEYTQSESQVGTQSSNGAGSTHSLNQTMPNSARNEVSAKMGEQHVDPEQYFTAPADDIVLLERTPSQAGVREAEVTPSEQGCPQIASPAEELEDEQSTAINDLNELPSALNAAYPRVNKRSASETPSESKQHRRKRAKNSTIAYQAALGINGLTWADYGGLVSARHEDEEEEL